MTEMINTAFVTFKAIKDFHITL